METTNTNKYQIIEGRMVDTEPKPKGWKGEYNGKGWKLETNKPRRILFWVNMEELQYLTNNTDRKLHPKLKTHFENRVIKYKDVIDELEKLPTSRRGRPSRQNPSVESNSTDFEEEKIQHTIEKEYKEVKKEIEGLEISNLTKKERQKAKQKESNRKQYEKSIIKKKLLNVKKIEKIEQTEQEKKEYHRVIEPLSEVLKDSDGEEYMEF